MYGKNHRSKTCNGNIWDNSLEQKIKMKNFKRRKGKQI